MTTAAQPYRPIPSGELPDDTASRYLRIRPVSIQFFTSAGLVGWLDTDSSAVALARVREFARNREFVAHFEHGGLEADFESIRALNCYLRTSLAMGRMKLPFDRLALPMGTGACRYTWSAFCEHLALNFR